MDFQNILTEVEKSSVLPPEFPVIEDMPKMSTFQIGHLIHDLVKNLPEGQKYVNVGVFYGFSLLTGMLGNRDKNVVGVDNFSLFTDKGNPRDSFRRLFLEYGSDKHEFFEMDFREYFNGTHKGEIGLYFYDGDHSYEAQFEGLKLAEPYFADGCLIMVDDTNQEYPKQATLDFMKQSPFRYEVVFDQPTDRPYDPEWWNGIMIIQKVGSKFRTITEEEAEG